MKLKTAIFLISFLILTLPLIQAPSETEFNSENIYSWKENPEEVLNLNSDERNPIINNANPGIRATIIKEMTIELSEQKYFARLKVNNALSKLTGVTDAGISIQDVKGFENPEIQFTKDNLLSDGNIEIDLDNIPINTKEIEYIPAKAGQSSKLIYTFKDNSKITIESGSIDQEHNYINQEQNIGLEETQRKVQLFPGETGTIEVDKNVQFKFSKDAKVQIGDRTFQAKEGKQGALKIEGDSHFKASNLKVSTPSLDIDIPETITDIIFKQGDVDSNQYVQVFETTENDITTKNVNLVGKDIAIDLEEDNFFITGNGENLVIDNKKLRVKLDGEEININRYQGAAGFEAKILNLQNPDQLISVSPKAVSYKYVGNPDKLVSEVSLKHKDLVAGGAFGYAIEGKKLNFKTEINSNGEPIVTAVSEGDGNWISLDTSLENKEFSRFLDGRTFLGIGGQGAEDKALIENLHKLYNGNENGEGSIDLLRERAESDSIELFAKPKEHKVTSVSRIEGDYEVSGFPKTRDVSKEFVRIISGETTKEGRHAMTTNLGLPPSDFAKAPNDLTVNDLAEYLRDTKKRIELLPMLDLTAEYDLAGQNIPIASAEAARQLQEARGSTKRPYIDGKDIYDSFFSKKIEDGRYEGTIFEIERQGLKTFSQTEKDALSSMLKTHLPESTLLPGSNSKVYITSGIEPEIRISTRVGSRESTNYNEKITDPEQIKVLNEIYYYNLLMENPEVIKNTNGKYKSAIERIHAEAYPIRERCYSWPCVLK